MQDNNEKRRERNSSAVLFDVRAFILTLVIMMTTMLLSGGAYAANTNTDESDNGKVSVATYEQLRVALEDTPGVKEITIDPQAAAETGDVTYSVEDDENSEAFYIPFDGPLTVAHEITIKNAEGVDVYFARSNSFRRDQGKPALLNVDPTGSLRLEGYITMTGEEVVATFDEGDEENSPNFLFSVKTKDGTGEDNEVWNRGQLPKGGFYIQNNGGKVSLDGDVILADFFMSDDIDDVEAVYQNNDIGLLFANRAANSAMSEATEEATEPTETVEEPIEVTPAPKKSLRSLKSPMLMNTQPTRGGDTTTSSIVVVDGTTTVSTTRQLKAALAHKDVTTIIIDETGAFSEVGITDESGNKNVSIEYTASNPDKKFYLPVDEPLTMVNNDAGNRSITIKSKTITVGDKEVEKEVVIARSELFENKATSETPAIFNVPSGVTLNLSSKITMSGDTVTSAYKYKDNAGNNLNESGYSPGQEAIDSGVFALDGGEFFGIIQKLGGGLQHENYLGKVSGDATVEGQAAKELSVNSDGFIILTHNNKTCHLSKEGKVIEGAPSVTAGDWRLKALDKEGNPTAGFVTQLTTGTKYVITSGTNFYGNDLYVKFNGDSFSRDASIGGAIQFKAAKSVEDAENDQEYEGIKFKFNVVPATRTAEEVKPGGYFIHAADHGNVIINDGVTLTGLHTAADVKNAAPVYIAGGSSFNMNGGTISGNTVGYGADEKSDSQQTIQWLKNKLRTGLTNTAGGIIFAGNGTKASITGGTIEKNQADSGAMIVKDDALVEFGTDGSTATNNPSLDENIGWHHAGAVLVENGGSFVMYSGRMKSNTTWSRGGAVWATEWGTAGIVDKKNGRIHNFNVIKNLETGKKIRKGGNFVMKGGLLDRNMAFIRGGAINIESDGVQLIGGTISNNMCKSLGGGIYVEGDDPEYSYTLVINNGYIARNKAVAGPNKDLDKMIENNRLVKGDDWTASRHNDADFPQGHSGNGGGVWLCPLGGTSVFSSTTQTTGTGVARVIIDNNTAQRTGPYGGKKKPAAEGGFGFGDDFYLSRGKGSALVQNLIGDWYRDNEATTKVQVGDGTVLSGPLGLYNNGEGGQAYTSGPGIQIVDNISRDGGGIAANGTVLLGRTDDVYRYNAELNLEKDWKGTSAEPVNLRLQYKVDEEYFPLTVTQTYTTENNETETVEVKYDLDMTGTPDLETITEDDVFYESSGWHAKAFIPAFVTHTDGSEVELFYVKDTSGREYHFNKLSDLEDLFKYIADLPSNAHGITDGSTKTKDLTIEWNIYVEETVDGRVDKYRVTSDVLSMKGEATSQHVVQKDPLNPSNTLQDFYINFSTIKYGQKLTNHLKESHIDLTKTALDGTRLTDAEFVLYKAMIKERVNNQGDMFVLNGTGSGTVSAYKTNIKATDGNSIRITGVEPDCAYFLFETKAPAGYELPKSPWFIYVDPSGNVTVTRMSDANQGMTTGGNNNPYDVSSGNDANGQPTSLNTWLKSKWWKREWFNVTKDSYNLNKDNVAVASNIKFVTDSTDTTNYQGVTLTPTDNVNNLQNVPFKLTKKNDENEAQGGVAFELKGAKVKSGNIIVGAKTNNGDIVSSSNSNTLGEIDLSGAINTSPRYGNENDGTVTALANKRTFLLYETAPLNMYRTPTAPWLILIDKTTGTIEVREHNNKYASPTVVSEGNAWKYEDFTKVVFGYTTGTTTTTGDRILVNDYAEIKLDKVGPGGEPVNGATFQLYAIKDNTGDNRYDTTTNPTADTDPKAFGGTLTSSDGKVDITSAVKAALAANPAWRKFILLETGVPENSGYTQNKAPWLITIDDHGTVTSVEIHNKAGVATYSGKDYDGSNTPKKWIGWNKGDFTPVNDKKLHNSWTPAEVEKVGVGTEVINSGTFKLFKVQETDNGWGGFDYTVVASFGAKDATISNGKISLPIDGPGDYFLFETSAPAGYVRPVDPWLISVANDKSVTVYTLSKAGKSGKCWIIGNNNEQNFEVPAELTVESLTSPIIKWPVGWFKDSGLVSDKKLVNEKFNVKLDKVKENGNALNGAKFDLYSTQISSDKKYYELAKKQPKINISDIISEDGEISLPITVAGDYFLFETYAPEGFERALEPWLLRVDEFGKCEVYEYKNTDDDYPGIKWVGGGHAVSDIPTTYADVVSGINQSWRGWRIGWYNNSKVVSGKIVNKWSDMELIKYKSGETNTLLTGAKFELIPLEELSLSHADDTITPKTNETNSGDSGNENNGGESGSENTGSENEGSNAEDKTLVRLTNADLADGLEVVIVDPTPGRERLFKAPGTTSGSVGTDSLKPEDYPEEGDVSSYKFTLEKHEVNGETLYALKDKNDYYLTAETYNEDWTNVNTIGSFQSGQYSTWGYTLQTSLFKIDISRNEFSINAYWYKNQNEVHEYPLIVKYASHWNILRADRYVGSEYLPELYKERSASASGSGNTGSGSGNPGTGSQDGIVRIQMTESASNPGHYFVDHLKDGFYQLVETKAPNGGYDIIPNEIGHRMIIQVHDGEFKTIVPGSDTRLSLNTNNVFQLKLANDELTRKTAVKSWAGGEPSNITSVVFTLYAKKGNNSTKIETRTVRNIDNWRTTFENLPKYYYAEGKEGTAVRKEIEYIVVESPIEGYSPTYETNGDTITVTNHKNGGGKVTLTVDKKWRNVPDNQKTEIKIELYSDYKVRGKKEQVLKEIETLKADNNWTVTITDLPLFGLNKNPKYKVTYWIKEKGVEGFRQVSVNEDGSRVDSDGDVQAAVGQSEVIDNNDYKAYSYENPSLVNSGLQNARSVFYIERPDGTREPVYCINRQRTGPTANGTTYKRIEIKTAKELKDALSSKEYGEGGTSTYWHQPTGGNVLRDTLLRLMLAGYETDIFNYLETNKISTDKDTAKNLFYHLTQFAVYEYTDFYYVDRYNYGGYAYHTDYTSKTSKKENWDWITYGRSGYYRNYGPYGLMASNTIDRVVSGQSTNYLNLLQQAAGITDTELSEYGLKLYLYKPVKANGEVDTSYQYLIGADTATVNMFAHLNNEVDNTDITIYKHSSKSDDTFVNGAKFKLYEELPEGTAAESNDKAFTVNGQSKQFRPRTKVYETAVNGKVTLNNLVPGKYYVLEETGTPIGYIKPDKPIIFKLTSTNTEIGSIGRWDPDKAEEVILSTRNAEGAAIAVQLNVANEPVYDLPKSGGMGTYWFMVIGAMMMGFALTAGFTKMNLLQILRR